MNISPTKDIVLVLADKTPEKTASGLFMSEDWKSLPLEGEVLAIGPEVQNLNIGDRIIFERYSSVILPDDQRLCKARHIFAVLGQNG